MSRAAHTVVPPRNLPSALFDAFESVARRHPHRNATSQGGRATRYDALLSSARGLSRHLDGRCGGAPFVGVFLEPGDAYLAAVLAVASVDKGFCPLEPHTPPLRLARMLAQAQPTALVTDEGLLPRLLDLLGQSGLPAPHILVLRRDGAMLDARWVERVGPAHPPFGLGDDMPGLYLLFTSGSTGEPKGIVGSTGGLLHFLEWEIGEFQLDERTAVPQLAPLSFDVSLRDLFAPLLAGGQVCFLEPGGGPAALPRLLAEARCTLMHCVPSMLRLLMEVSTDLPAATASLRHILLAGEPLYGKDVNAWRRLAGGGAELVNLYGPSEATLAKFFHRIGPGGLPDGEVVPLGLPLPGVSFRLENPEGGVGEIVIETPYLSLGYLGLPEETRARFIADPATGAWTALRTGDLGHVRADGLLGFNGRRDNQLKVRGNRVELAEVEACFMRHPRVRQAAVAARQVASNDISLVCFLRHDGGPLGQAELARHAAAELPPYMQPSRYVEMGGRPFPLNANGKIDRAALLGLLDGLALAPAGGDAPGPLDGAQAEVLAVFRDLLARPGLGPDEHFFASGGSSLSGITAAARLSRGAGTAIGLADLLRAPTARELGALLQARRVQPRAPVEAATPCGAVPATPFQRLFWEFCQFKESKLAYNEPVLFELRGALSIDACRQVLAALLERHEGLRTGVAMEEGRLVQRVVPPAALEGKALDVIDLRGRLDAREQAGRLMAGAALELFDLAAPPLFRARLFLLAEGEAWLHLLFAHVTIDDFSLRLLMVEAAALYRTYQTDAPLRLEPAFPGCRAQAERGGDAAWRDDLSWQAHIDDWRAVLAAGDRRLHLPFAQRRPLIKSHAGDRVEFALADPAALRALASRRRTSLFCCLLTAVGGLLAAEADQADAVLGVPMAARGFPGAECTVGNFLNTLPLLVDGPARGSFEERLRLTHERLAAAQRHADVPLDAWVRELSPAPDFSRSALFDVGVTLTENASRWAGQGLEVERLPLHNGRSKLDLMFLFNDEGGAVTGLLEFNTRLFERAPLQALLGRLDDALRLAAHGEGA